MKIDSLFQTGRTVLSFEIFPPKRDNTRSGLFRTLELLRSLNPDFISVTFGAGGTAAENSTFEIAGIVKNQFGIEPLVHLTGINSLHRDIDEALLRLNRLELQNIMALRGDRRADGSQKDDFPHAADLISYIRSRGDYHISAACYPEGHIEAKSIAQDVSFLKQKVEAGASHLISQLFFDNGLFYAFLERAARAGIRVPIEAGIMPVVDKSRIERMVSLCGASLPEKFRRILEKYENHPEALQEAGIAYAVEQIVDLIAHDVDGIHLYTMNNPQVTSAICAGIESLFSVSRSPFPRCVQKQAVI